MTFEYLVEHYGYVAILLGTLLEGESILIIAGYMAHRGYLALPGVILAAFIGSLTIDQSLFFLTRLKGFDALRKFKRAQEGLEHVDRLVARYPRVLLVGFRFLYGLRTVTPLALGLTSVKASRFVMYNAVGALLWATTISTGGYIFGRAIEAFFARAKHYEAWVIAAIAVASVVVVLIRKRIRKRKVSPG